MRMCVRSSVYNVYVRVCGDGDVDASAITMRIMDIQYNVVIHKRFHNKCKLHICAAQNVN